MNDTEKLSTAIACAFDTAILSSTCGAVGLQAVNVAVHYCTATSWYSGDFIPLRPGRVLHCTMGLDFE